MYDMYLYVLLPVCILLVRISILHASFGLNNPFRINLKIPRGIHWNSYLTMFFSSPAVQSVSNVKSAQQLEAVSQRLGEITNKLSKATIKSDLPAVKGGPGWDWTKSYANWGDFEDVEELKLRKEKEESNLEDIHSKKDALGHYHDHSKEREFFEQPESEKFSACEDNRLMGNYLFKEGIFPKAAEHYQIAIAYYEYCFPSEDSEQALLDELRRACLCNISICYRNMGYLRQAVEMATMVLKETDGLHGKALFRRAQAYRDLDEYDLAVQDLVKANELQPGDQTISAELQLLKTLASGYKHNRKEFAKQSLNSADNLSHAYSTVHSVHHAISLEEEMVMYSDSLFNPAMPLEPVLPTDLQAIGTLSAMNM